MKRVAVTGIGVVAPGGNDVDTFWDSMCAGESHTELIRAFDPSRFRSQTAAACDFDPVSAGLGARRSDRLDRATQMLLVAADQAWENAGADQYEVPGEGIAVAVGNAVGLTASLEHEYSVSSDDGSLWDVSVDHTSAHVYDHFVPSSMAAEVAEDFGAAGSVSVVSTGCTSGIDAIGSGYEQILAGEADVVIAGATEAPLSPITSACFDAILASSPLNDDPHRACRPYGKDRAGLVLGEGAAVLLLEDYDKAIKRGAPVLCEVRGYATRCNAMHMTALAPDGEDMAEAAIAALKQAGLSGDDVDYVNLHGSGTAMNDRHETGAIKRALCENAWCIPMSSIKSMVGHSLGAIGAIESVACVKAIETDRVPPTANLDNPDPELDLDYTPIRSRRHTTDVALSVGSGFGGFQSAIIFAKEGVHRD